MTKPNDNLCIFIKESYKKRSEWVQNKLVNNQMFLPKVGPSLMEIVAIF